MRILVYGLGRSGLAAARLCLRQGLEVAFFEQRAQGADIDELEALGCTRLSDVASADAETCIAAPGVPFDHPDLQRLRALGTETIGEVEWVYRTVAGEYVGVTGTAGKGTVTRWLADTLALAGVQALAGGNLDPALAEVAREGATMVVELSSFQLERCPTLQPDIAVVLNLGSDHLDRHGSLAAYHGAKRNLLNNLGPDELFVYNADDPLLPSWAAACPARSAGYSLLRPAAAWLDGDTLRLGETALLRAGELAVPGRHQISNALAVALAARERGLDDDEIRAGLRAFRGLPGRYSEAGRIGNVLFIEDSIATRPLSVMAALGSTPAPVVWIAGGQSKGADVRELETLVRERVCLFVGIGRSGPELAEVVGQWVPAHLCSERDGAAALRSAVRVALQHLRAHARHGGTVLLAPLAASFDQFRDYRERAELFRAAVQAEEVAWTPSW